MSLRVVFLFLAVAITACGAAPTGRSTLPVSEVTPISNSRPTTRIADPTLPDKEVSISAEGAFASTK